MISSPPFVRNTQPAVDNLMLPMFVVASDVCDTLVEDMSGVIAVLLKRGIPVKNCVVREASIFC